MPSKRNTAAVCDRCGLSFMRAATSRQRFCDLACRNAGPLTATLPRFWSKVDKSGECWVWTGDVARNGYGRFSLSGRHLYAHRFSYELVNGPVGPNTDVCHRCDNPPCVRPDHLFAGTRKVNMADMAQKGRAQSGDRHYFRQHPERVPRGEARGGSKLTAGQVAEIRSLFQTGGLTQKQIAARFGIGQTAVSNIRSGKKWAHLS